MRQIWSLVLSCVAVSLAAPVANAQIENLMCEVQALWHTAWVQRSPDGTMPGDCVGNCRVRQVCQSYYAWPPNCSGEEASVFPKAGYYASDWKNPQLAAGLVAHVQYALSHASKPAACAPSKAPT